MRAHTDIEDNQRSYPRPAGHLTNNITFLLALALAGRPIKRGKLLKMFQELKENIINDTYSQQRVFNASITALKILKTLGQVKNVQHGYWEITRSGWRYLQNYYLRYGLPDEYTPEGIADVETPYMDGYKKMFTRICDECSSVKYVDRLKD